MRRILPRPEYGFRSRRVIKWRQAHGATPATAPGGWGSTSKEWKSSDGAKYTQEVDAWFDSTIRRGGQEDGPQYL